jgi:6-phosphogluconolactonase/glucosamine-6-phosphate isomerase/deaminase
MRDDKVTTAIPATLLKLHPDVTVICDKEAYNG